MSGLGSVQNDGATFLVVAGGYIWDKKAPESDPNFATQDYEKADKTTGTRRGARYADLTGIITKVAFRTHAEYGESINVTFKASKDFYTVSISTNNRYSQDLMKALLVMDLDEPIMMKPYDFIGSDKKRAQGISFKQNGEKLDLKIEDAPSESAEFFKKGDKKKIKRFFEDLNDWFIAEIEANVIPNIKASASEVDDEEEEEKPAAKKPAKKSEEEKPAAKKSEEKKPEAKPAKKAEPAKDEVGPIGMKKAIKAYIKENYEDKEMPALDSKDLKKWYKLVLDEEELPFEDFEEEEEESEEEEEDETQMSQEELDAELDALAGED
jgi:hypothetical protein